MTRLLLLALQGWLMSQQCSGFYWPEVNPQSFEQGDVINLKVNKVTSTKTLMPQDYYKLPFCRPEGGPKMDDQNLGQFLSGDRIESSPYLLRMKEDMYCQQVCISNLGIEESSGMDPNRMVKAIRKEYHNNWIVDNLSSACKVEDDATITTRYWQGFPIGFVAQEDHTAYIHNHVNLEIMYHPVDEQVGKYRVVRFTVEPFSILHDYGPLADVDDDIAAMDDEVPRIAEWAKIKNPIASCNPNIPVGERKHTTYEMVTDSGRLPQPASGKVLFTYDVIWIQNDDLHWASRWDIYMSMDNAIPAEVHWLGISSSLISVIVFSAMIIAILLRNLRQNYRHKQLATGEEKADDLEEKGWKAVHADVFRPPSTAPLFLCVCCGTGAQLLCMTFWTIFFQLWDS